MSLIRARLTNALHGDLLGFLLNITSNMVFSDSCIDATFCAAICRLNISLYQFSPSQPFLDATKMPEFAKLIMYANTYPRMARNEKQRFYPYRVRKDTSKILSAIILLCH